MPDSVHGSDKIHTLVALYTALLSNRRQTHTHTHTHIHTHTHRYWRDKLDVLVDFPVNGLDLPGTTLMTVSIH